MLKHTLITTVSGAALLAATSANAFVSYDVEDIQEVSYAGSSFSQNLAREYKEFATYEAYKMYDWIDAEHFAEKAIAAAGNGDAAPESVADWDIPEQHVADLNMGRQKLENAFSKGAKTIAPREAAIAQAKYDCWMEQQEENHQWAHIAACKGEFYAALDVLNGKMKPKQVTSTEKVEMPVSQQAAIFFGFDQAVLTAQAERKLDSLADSIEDKNAVELRVVGHADTSGPKDYNEALSRKRAQAVIDELRERGMRVAELKDLDVVAKGESAPIVDTGDGVREQANRLVEIFAHAQQPMTVNVTKQSANTSQ